MTSFWREGQDRLMPLKYICNMNPESLPEDTDPDFEMEYIDIGNVSLEHGIQERQILKFMNSPSRARKPIRAGDTIVSTVRTYLKAVAFVQEDTGNWVASTGFAVLRPKAKVNEKYLYYTVQAQPFIESVVASSTGVSYPAINPSRLGTLKVTHPTLDVQVSIVDFLDHETARIDRLIEHKKKILELILEKKAALIVNAVDGSLIGAPTEDGLTGWFGSVPSFWNVRRAKFLFREQMERSVTGEEELLTVSHLTGVSPRAEKDVTMFLAETLEGYKIIKPGDVAVNTMWAWMGAMGVSPINGIISPSYAVYRPITDDFISDYLDLLLRSRPFVAKVNRRSKGVWSSRLRLYPDAFMDIRLPVPPKENQLEILAKLKKATEREERIADLSRQSIDRLKELRSALITAAVTDQIDVTAWRRQGHTDRQIEGIEAELSV